MSGCPLTWAPPKNVAPHLQHNPRYLHSAHLEKMKNDILCTVISTNTSKASMFEEDFGGSIIAGDNSVCVSIGYKIYAANNRWKVYRVHSAA